jgi:hypothetical protein
MIPHTGELLCDSVEVCHCVCLVYAGGYKVSTIICKVTPCLLRPCPLLAPCGTVVVTRLYLRSARCPDSAKPAKHCVAWRSQHSNLFWSTSLFIKQSIVIVYCISHIIRNTSPKCSHSLANRLSLPHFPLSPAQARSLVFNSMPSGICMLSEVIRMSSSVEVVHGDVGHSSRDLSHQNTRSLRTAPSPQNLTTSGRP